MFTEYDDLALRRCAFAISVLDDIEIIAVADGIELPGVPTLHIGWDELRIAVRSDDPESVPGRAKVSAWLRYRRWLGNRPHAELRELARPVGLPVGHPMHPGTNWPRHRVLGDVLDLGLGVAGLDPARPDDVVVVPTALLKAAGYEPSLWWHDARLYLERMAGLAIDRWQRSPGDVLRPMGDCDVVTLLGSALFRAALCAESGGMRAVVAPMRTRGWVDLSRIDPAFAMAAAAASDPSDRGFPRALLITADEVVMAADGGRHEIVLRDPSTDSPQHLRPVLYHQ